MSFRTQFRPTDIYAFAKQQRFTADPSGAETVRIHSGLGAEQSDDHGREGDPSSGGGHEIRDSRASVLQRQTEHSAESSERSTRGSGSEGDEKRNEASQQAAGAT